MLSFRGLSGSNARRLRSQSNNESHVVIDAKTESLADLVQAPSVLHYRDVTTEFCARRALARARTGEAALVPASRLLAWPASARDQNTPS
jgi:hypothetical protein